MESAAEALGAESFHFHAFSRVQSLHLGGAEDRTDIVIFWDPPESATAAERHRTTPRSWGEELVDRVAQSGKKELVDAATSARGAPMPMCSFGWAGAVAAGTAESMGRQMGWGSAAAAIEAARIDPAAGRSEESSPRPRRL